MLLKDTVFNVSGPLLSSLTAAESGECQVSMLRVSVDSWLLLTGRQSEAQIHTGEAFLRDKEAEMPGRVAIALD